MKTKIFVVMVFCLAALVLTSCAMAAPKPAVVQTTGNPTSAALTVVALQTKNAPMPTATVAPTQTAYPTNTAYPTYTPAATQTKYPTYTAVPTHTAVPTDIPTESPTAIPTEMPTAVPTVAEALVAPTMLTDSSAVIAGWKDSNAVQTINGSETTPTTTYISSDVGEIRILNDGKPVKLNVASDDRETWPTSDGFAAGVVLPAGKFQIQLMKVGFNTDNGHFNSSAYLTMDQEDVETRTGLLQVAEHKKVALVIRPDSSGNFVVSDISGTQKAALVASTPAAPAVTPDPNSVVTTTPVAPTVAPAPIDMKAQLLGMLVGSTETRVVHYWVKEKSSLSNTPESLGIVQGPAEEKKFHTCMVSGVQMLLKTVLGEVMTSKNMTDVPELHYISDNIGQFAILDPKGGLIVQQALSDGWLGAIVLQPGEQLCFTSDGYNNGHQNAFTNVYSAPMLSAMTGDEQEAFIRDFADQELWPRDHKPLQVMFVNGKILFKK